LKFIRDLIKKSGVKQVCPYCLKGKVKRAKFALVIRNPDSEIFIHDSWRACKNPACVSNLVSKVQKHQTHQLVPI